MHTSNVVVAWVLATHDRLLAGMRGVELDARELAALTLVAEHDGCSVEWLRVRIDLTQSGTVRLVDRLAHRGLLRRGTPAGRAVPLHVTPGGTAKLDEWGRVRDEIVADLLHGVPAELRDVLVDGVTTALRTRQRRRSEADTTCRGCTWTACGDDCPVSHSVTEEGT